MSEFKGTINRNGRPKGAQSKVTIETRKAFNELIDGNIGQIQEDLQKLKPYERIKVILDMARFVIPTLKAVELESQTQTERFKPVIINFTHNETDTD